MGRLTAESVLPTVCDNYEGDASGAGPAELEAGDTYLSVRQGEDECTFSWGNDTEDRVLMANWLRKLAVHIESLEKGEE